MYNYTISNIKKNSTFSLHQKSRGGTFDSNLISRQYKLNLMADFEWINYENPKLKQPEIANQLGYPFSTLERYINVINMLSPYTIQRNDADKRTKRLQKLILTSIHIKNMTSKDLK